MSKPQKQARLSLQERERNFSALAENANDGILIATIEGNHVYANKRAAEITGYSVSELLEIHMRELTHPDELPKLSERLKKRLAGERVPAQYETAIIRKDGQTMPVEVTEAQTVWQGQPVDLAIIRDITEQKRTEEALQESEKRYRRITETVTDYIYTVHIQDGRPVETTHSPACVAVTGYTAEEFRENPYLWIEMVYEDDRKFVQKLASDILSGLQVKPLEHRIIRKDGILRWVRNTSVLHDDNQGKLVSCDGLIQDITERKQMEIALEEERASLARKVEERTAELSRVNAELARAAQLKDEFLSTMSHELRTPLNIIMGMSEALQDGVYGSLNEKQLKALHRITEGGNHLLTLITDILDLSAISTGRKELDIGPVAVESVCQAGLRFIHRSVQKKGVKLSFMFDSAVTTIYTDGCRLKQVLVNLLNNAIKFTPEGGEIGLDVETDPENYVVRFTVWDTGIGIAKEDMKRLFQPFVQLDSSLSRRYEGTGLGLNLVYRIVDILGGSVSVESEVERGSRFTISLPWEESGNGEMGRVGDGETGRVGDGETGRVGDGEMGRWGEREKGRKGEREPSPYSPHLPISPSPHLPISPSPHLPISPLPQSATILIADDNEITIQTLSRFFTLKGYRLKIARNGWETFAYTRETRPVLILVDIQMPEMDGLETIRHIRADKSGQSIPIIALTSLATPGDQEECLAAGANVYLIKPVGPRKLSEIIENFLSGKE